MQTKKPTPREILAGRALLGFDTSKTSAAVKEGAVKLGVVKQGLSKVGLTKSR